MTCDFGGIPAGEERSVSVTFFAADLGNKIIEARASAANNPSTHNDRQQQPVRITLNADAAISMTASASTVLIGDPVDFNIVVSSIRTRAIHNATVEAFDLFLRHPVAAGLGDGAGRQLLHCQQPSQLRAG